MEPDFKTKLINDFEFIKNYYDVNPIAAEIFEGMIVQSYEYGYVSGASKAVMENGKL